MSLIRYTYHGVIAPLGIKEINPKDKKNRLIPTSTELMFILDR